MTRRDTQLAWLIRFARSWKYQSADRQRALNDDPWAMKEFAETIQSPQADSARLALLHLAHPDTFEAIVSSDHKRSIIDRFADVAGEDEDEDRRLLAARVALTPQYGEGFDWYRDLLVQRWWKNRKAWSTFLGWLKRFRAMPTFDADERVYKLELASKVGEARDRSLAEHNGWFMALKSAFLDPVNNLTQWQGHDSFIRWVDDDRRAGLAALLALWDGDDAPVERLQSRRRSAFAPTNPA